MKTTALRNALAAAALAATVAPSPAAAQWAPAGEWKYVASIYMYLPQLNADFNIPLQDGGTAAASTKVSPRDLLRNLKFTFMGAFDAHNGRWGVFTDLIYLNEGGRESSTRNLEFNGRPLPIGVTKTATLDLETTIWTLAGQYRVVADQAWTVDLLAGARMLNIKPKLGWSLQGDLGDYPIPGRQGSAELSETSWDGIVGAKGRYTFGDRREWFVPFYVDVGTGQIDLTWQIAGGIGYSFSWGEIVALWRYLDFENGSGSKLDSLSTNGPMLGVNFRW